MTKNKNVKQIYVLKTYSANTKMQKSNVFYKRFVSRIKKTILFKNDQLQTINSGPFMNYVQT